MTELIEVKEKDGQQLVNARELHKFLEVKTAFKDWIVRMIEYGFEADKDFSSFLSGTKGRPKTDYALTLDMAKELSMIQRSEKGKQARRYFIECEKKFRELKPSLPQTYSEALRELADKQEALELAIATKAEIGNRREATAMNTASVQAKKAKKLEIELDTSKEYCTIKRMQMLYHGQKFNWRLLKSTGVEMGIQTVDVFDANYGTVKAYHKDVWKEAYNLSF